MDRVYRMKTWKAIVLLAAAETLCVGAGMGVPVFVILFGVPVGWWIGRRNSLDAELQPSTLRRALWGALVPASMTLGFMAVIWLPQIRLLGDPSFDAAEWGIPMWLYTPTASFWGWMALMVVVSPALQLLTAVFGAFLALMLPGHHERAAVRNPSN